MAQNLHYLSTYSVRAPEGAEEGATLTITIGERQ